MIKTSQKHKNIVDFSRFIEELAASDNITIIEAVIEFCSSTGSEPEVVAQKLSGTLKQKLIQEYRDLNYLPKQAQIELD